MKGGSPMLIEKKVLYVAEAASLLGCCAQVVYQLIENGKLQAYKEEGRKCWRIPAEDLESYIKNCKDCFLAKK